jgi:hypothetical protein
MKILVKFTLEFPPPPNFYVENGNSLGEKKTLISMCFVAISPYYAFDCLTCLYGSPDV